MLRTTAEAKITAKTKTSQSIDSEKVNHREKKGSRKWPSVYCTLAEAIRSLKARRHRDTSIGAEPTRPNGGDALTTSEGTEAPAINGTIARVSETGAPWAPGDTSIPTPVCMYVCMYACMYVSMYACMHAYMHGCSYVALQLCRGR